MTRSIPRALALLWLAAGLLPADSPGCTLEISMNCPARLQGTGTCTSTTRNVGMESCAGLIYSGFFGPQGSTVRFSTSGAPGECFTSADFPQSGLDFPFAFCIDSSGAIAPGQTRSMTVGVAGGSGPTGIEAFTAVFDEITFETIAFASTFDTVEVATCVPRLSSPGAVRSGVPYQVFWTEVSEQGATYELQESVTPDFSIGVTTRTTSALSAEFTHTVAATTPYFYRVRAVSCNGTPGEYSRPAVAIVTAEQDPRSSRFDVVLPVGSRTPVLQPIFIANPGEATSFTASFDQPWGTLSQEGGTLPPEGLPVTLTVDPADLPVGSTTGTLTLELLGASKTAMNGGTTSVPVSVTLVTPVSSGGKTTPPANAMVIPVVAHVAGQAFFQSDVRLSNNTGATVDYEMFFTPSNSNGLEEGRKTTIRLTPGQTVALNDIVKNFFGFAEEQSSVGGAVEIRPLRTSSTLSMVSSRTYATSDSGTLGQFIPGVPLANFIGVPTTLPGQPPPSGPPPVISLQQIARNSAFRTNIGLVEASGEAAQGRVRIFDANGTLVREDPFSLQPAEHKQFALQGVTLDDGRLEVVVDSASGRVTAYASVLDNETDDPFFVAPVRPSDVAARRYVLPGVAALDRAPPASNFFTDVRIFNGGASAVTATLRYFPQGSDAPTAATEVSIMPGQVRGFDDILQTLFGLEQTGGALVVETAEESSLVVTGRTYSRAGSGTYGQFIPAVTASGGTALGQRPLEVLQIEESPGFRTNLGLVELTGNPVQVEIVVTIPGSASSIVVPRSLKANEFIQLNSVLAQLNVGTAYNVRATVRVVSGSGRVAAYASVIDNRTVDPTYVPGQ
ncbi:MAG TPA: DUF5719 family protein [Thermoanaerobaculia bacterium]|nr:DUF5719 family protein [Thermoanaerobaculia bacterium]